MERRYIFYFQVLKTTFYEPTCNVSEMENISLSFISFRCQHSSNPTRTCIKDYTTLNRINYWQMFLFSLENFTNHRLKPLRKHEELQRYCKKKKKKKKKKKTTWFRPVFAKKKKKKSNKKLAGSFLGHARTSGIFGVLHNLFWIIFIVEKYEKYECFCFR